MRMAADELLGDCLHHVAKIESALFLGHAGVKDDLEQQIAQLFFEIGKIAARDGVGDLVGFFQRIGRDGREILLPDPTGSRSPACASAAMISMRRPISREGVMTKS